MLKPRNLDSQISSAPGLPQGIDSIELHWQFIPLSCIALSTDYVYTIDGGISISMQRFDYRSPRYAVDIPVRLTAENSACLGRCRDISQEGMRLDLQQPLPPDACGTVSMTYQNQTLELNVRVAHAGATRDGMKFIYSSDSERKAVARLVASLTDPHDRRRLVLVN